MVFPSVSNTGPPSTPGLPNKNLSACPLIPVASLNPNKSITLGANYQKVFQAFALETTYDLGKVMSRWNRKGYIEKLISLIR